MISAQIAAELVRDESPALVLDLGAGFGEVSLLFAERSKATVIAADLSERATLEADRASKSANLDHRVQAVRADCYHLGFADASFDAVISFGYASAASYDGAQSEVARVLRPGGVAVVDFRNISIYNTLLNPGAGWRIWDRYHRRDKVYHFGPIGLREHFRPVGLELESIVYFNTYPPLGNRLSTSAYLKLEQIGRKVGRPVARVFAAKLRRV